MNTGIMLRIITDSLVKETNPADIIIALSILVVLILIGVIASRVSKGSKGGTSGNKSMSTGSFKRLSKKIGLDKYETKLIVHLAKKYGVSNPAIFFNNSSSLDNALRRSIEEIDSLASEPHVKENRKAALFKIKQKIERNSHKKASYSGTKQIRINQPMAISPEFGGRFQSKVISNLKNNIGLQIPENSKEQQIRWQKWTKLKIFFWKKNGQGYSFATKVLGYNTLRGKSCLFVQHTNTIHQAQQRRFRRKELEKPAYFYPVRVITTGIGRNKQKKAIVDKGSNGLGTVIDISAGGCALKSSYPLGQGELIKLEFETGREKNISVYGKILGMRRTHPYGGIMHIRFTKISRSHMNRINSYVYDIDID